MHDIQHERSVIHDERSVRIDVWSDVVCPFCYIGKRSLESALAQTGIQADIRWRSFELDPAAPALIDRPLADLMAEKYGTSPQKALAFLERQQHAATEVGLEFNYADIKRGNTFDAHRLIKLAETHKMATPVTERLFRAYFTEGEPICDRDALRRLAVDAGLDGNETEKVLGGDAFADQVRADEHLAGELGVSAVPHFVINQCTVLTGARPAIDFITALHSLR